MKKNKIDYSKYKEISINDDLTKQGHGNTLSVKVVLPVGCQAKCDFCFGTCKVKDYKAETYFKRLDEALIRIRSHITSRNLSFDITGGEPTMYEGITKVFRTINRRRVDVPLGSEKIVLTTNGREIFDFYYSDAGSMVNIVNISMHSFDEHERKRIFGTDDIPDFEEVKRFCDLFSSKNVKCSAVCVITSNRLKTVRDLDEISFKDFLKGLSAGAKKLHFSDLRVRLNYLDPDSKILEEFFNTKFSPAEYISEQVGLCTKSIDPSFGFEVPVKIFKGVPDLVEAGVIGVEMVIDTDGNLYLDYERKYPIQDSDLTRFNDYVYVDRGLLVRREEEK